MPTDRTPPPPLPIDPVLPELCRVLAGTGAAVLEAPPGAGKTTRVPLALLDEAWVGDGRIIMLEPRRLAARASARRMAAMLGEAVGQTVGYRVRLDSRVGPRTRIEVVTEGLFIRRLQADPGLDGVAAVLFDEYHERSLDADLALALCLEAREGLREDLRLLVMSATLDGAAVAGLLGDVPSIRSEGRSFPVEIRHVDPGPVSLSGPGRRRLEDAVADTVLRALEEEPGSVLVFLPGTAEIRRAESLLRDRLPENTAVAPLYGDLPPERQDAAIAPAPEGRRKVVLATNIAETSLTIEGIRVVVDAGLVRVSRFDPTSGMTRLVTERVSQASAEQRRGRAGRLSPGVCYRLWPEGQHRALPAHSAPEMLAADLAPLVLELAQWGVADPAALRWLDPPPPAHFAQARDLLTRLGALDGQSRITAHGRAMADLGMHPRLAHMVLAARGLGLGALACDLAALLGERDALRGARDADLRLRVEMLRSGGGPGPLHQIRQLAAQWRRRLEIPDGKDRGGTAEDTGLLVALAYPDRIGQRRPGGEPAYRLANGRGAVFAEPDPLSGEAWLAIADLDGDRRNARIRLAAPVGQAVLEEVFADRLEEVEFVAWDAREEAVQARRQRRLGELVLSDRALRDAAPDRVSAAVCEGIRQIGLHCLPWTRETESLRARIGFLRRLEGEEAGWPDMSDEALLAGLEEWLGPFLDGVTRRAHFQRIPLADALGSLLDWPKRRELDETAPTHVAVPSGSRIPIDYASGETPVLAVRLQEMFGLKETPSVGRGRVPVLLHLLSPARRPVQVTRDLASFWAGAYKAVKADLKGQYPKHYWPDDPLQAEPTARAKPRGT
jgi:ATP-dependent helicase HrpB